MSTNVADVIPLRHEAPLQRCPECRRPRPHDAAMCASCEAMHAARLEKGFAPRRLAQRLWCEVCGAPEGDLHHWPDHDEHDERQRQEREREERIASMTAAKLAAEITNTHDIEPVLIDADEAARMLGISVEALYQRVSRHQVPGVVRPTPTSRRVQFHRATLLESIARKAGRR